jgi:hypothetical protein
VEASSAGGLAAEARRVLARRVLEQRRARTDLAYLISHMRGVDQRDGTEFTFEHVAEPLEPGEVTFDGNRLVARDKSWRWQRWVIDCLLDELRVIFLKGRQIGVTWIVLAVDVAEAVTMPGTASLLFRQREDEAVDNAIRWFTLFQSLPEHLRFGAQVVRPDLARTDRPGTAGIALKFPDGRISEVIPMSSAASSGHGRSVRRVVLDESAYIEKLSAIRAAVEPAAGRAKINLVSTANGRSNPETGEGNEHHRLWVAADQVGYKRVFLPYDVHPDRDADWYAAASEVQSLKTYQRQAQFPRDEHEAFALSERTFFEADDLAHYQTLIKRPLFRADFVDADDKTRLAKGARARLRLWEPDGRPVDPNTPCGLVRVFEQPVKGCRYAIGADPATGRGADYSAAYVVNLSTMALAVEFRGRLDEDLFAAQLHYLGRMYGRDVPADPKDPGTVPGFAKLAVENAGGYGNAVTAALRDRTAGRPAYGNLYRHLLDNRSDRPEAKPYGFPMNVATRPKAIGQLDQAVRQRTLPWVTDSLLHEMEDFIEHDRGTSPRAREGSHDDLVMACSIALEMYRLCGRHPEKRTVKARRGRIVGLGRSRLAA